MISSIDQANRPRDSPGDGRPGHPSASLLADFSSAISERRRLADGRASNAATDGGRHRCRTSNRYAGVVRHLGRLDDKINKCIKIISGDDQSNRSDPHRRPIGRSEASDLVQRTSCHQRCHCGTAGWTQQIQDPRSRVRSAQLSSRRARSSLSIWPPRASRASATSNACSVSSVIEPTGSPAAITWSAGGWRNPVEDTEARSDLFVRHQLGRHAERIANRQAIQRALGPVEDRAHLATDAKMLSTSAMSIIGL